MSFALLDQASQAQASQQASVWQMVGTIAIWVVVIAVFYFLFMRPQKKKQQQEEQLRNSIEIGDDVTTIGGIVGKIVAVREDDDTFVLETASDKTKMRFKKWAISSVDTPGKQPKPTEKGNKRSKKNKSEDKKELPEEKSTESSEN
ncbi:MAG: preprotein translocase subunit YajC [Acutalibacteraceae bacterium]